MRTLGWAGVQLCALLAACGGERGASTAPRTSLLTSQGTALATQVSWFFHPPRAAGLLARHSWGQGRTVYVGRRGERWLVDENSRSVRAAAQLAPEALIAAVALSAQAWAFVGEGGNVYESPDALADFSRVSAPKEPLLEVSATQEAIVGVGRTGELWRSADRGASWAQVGPVGIRFSDVALASDGNAIAFSIPERHWLSADAGKSWNVLPGEPFGMLGLQVRSGRILVRAALGRYSWNSGATLGGGFVQESTESFADLSLPFPEPKGPSARALRAGRAAIIGDRYYEIAKTEQTVSAGRSASRGAAWRLWRGPIQGSLEASELVKAAHCKELKLAGFSRWLYLACASNVGASKPSADTPLELFASEDGGNEWHTIEVTLRAKLDQLKIAVGAEGNLLLVGACAEAKDGCSASSTIHLSRPSAATGAQWVRSVGPSLQGNVEVLTFSQDGLTAFGFGRRNKSEVLGLFVSRDGGRTFEARDVQGVPIRKGSSSPLGIEAVSAAVDGTVSLSFSALPGTDARLLVLSEQGSVLGLSTAPKPRASIGVYGGRAVAVDRNGDSIWETLNGGATWQSAGRLPAQVCVPSGGSSNECVVDVVCAQPGCVFAESLTRLGWGLGATASSAEVLPMPSSEPAPPRYATPIGCTANDDQWRPLPLVQRAPTANQAALGGYAWFALGEDPASSEVALWRARGGKNAAVERRELLAPVPAPSRYAHYATLQIEGAAAIRYLVPTAEGDTLARVDVAWEDLEHGISGHSQLLSAGEYRADDAKKNGNESQRAQPELVSIADGGVYLRVHNERVTDQSTFFLDGKQVKTLPQQVNWPAELAGARGDVLRVGGAHFPVLFLGSTAVVRANARNGGWAFAAETVGLLDSERFGIEQEMNLTYWRGRPALQLTWVDAQSSRQWAQVLPFVNQGRIFGEPIVVPTQADIGKLPASCGAVDISGTPRVVAQPQAWTQHPVVVTEGSTLHTMLTAAAVLHGTKEKPCVAAFEATTWAQGNPSSPQTQAIIDPADLAHAWQFRRAIGSVAAGIEYRILNCQFDSNLELSPELSPDRKSNAMTDLAR